MTGTYVYGFTTGGRRLSLGRLGLPDGLSPVSTVAAEGLAAIVGDYRGPALAELPKPELLRCLAAHQRVLERALAERPVLPAKFGTLLASDDEVRGLLGRYAARLAAALAQLGDAVQIEVAATWDLKRTFAEVAAEPAVAVLAAAAAGRSPEESLAIRVQVGQLVKTALDRRREEVGRLVVGELAPLARDVQPNPLVLEELVLNLALLVERGRSDELDARVHQLDAALGGRLNFRCVGPLPPYSFATVEVVRPSAAEVERARTLLELGERAGEADVESSYRRLAVRHHPDRHPGDPLAATRFAALATAHALLRGYVRARAEADGEPGGERVDLSRAAVADAVLLTIRRAESYPASVPPEAKHEPSATTV